MNHGEDLAHIHQVLSRYIDGVNKRDAQIWGAAWDEEATWQLLDPEPVKGRSAIVAAWTEAMKGFPFVQMHTTQGTVEIDGDKATGSSYTFEVVKTADEKNMRVWGSYEDRYRKRDGTWRFSFRKFTIQHAEEY